MKKIKAFFEKGSGALFLGVICASVGSALFIPSAGLVSTLPFVFLFSLIPALVSEKSYHLPLMFFAVSYFFCFAKDVPLRYTEVIGGFTLYVAVFAAVISALGCAAAYFIKLALKNKGSRTLNALAAVVFAVLGVFATCYINGTPWGLSAAKNEIFDFVERNYTENELDIGGVYYVAERDYYACDAKIIGSEDRGSFVAKDKVTSTLDALAIQRAGAERAAEIAALLRNAFPEDSFTVNPDMRKPEGIRVSFENTDELEELLSYSVTIHSEETAKTFVDKTAAYVNVISSSKLDCDRITVTGGAKQKLYYTLSVDTTAPMGNISKLLRIYSTCPLPQSSVINAHNSF